MGEWKYKEDMTKKRQQRIGMIVGIVLIILLLLYWLVVTLDLSAYYGEW